MSVDRNVYQSMEGGKTYVPLEYKARLIGTSTPKFAKMLASKYAEMPGERVVRDLEENHSRKISKHYVQSISSKMGEVMRDKEVRWNYVVPNLTESIDVIAIGRDGTTTAIKKEGWRQTMVGTVALYGNSGQRHHTIHMACSPEKCKPTFNYLLDAEINKISNCYPNAERIGIGDGARDNWTFLDSRTEVQILDYYHLSEYINEYSELLFKDKKHREEWKDCCADNLFNKSNGAEKILAGMLEMYSKINGKRKKEKADTIITYVKNNKNKMAYKKYIAKGYPIGSGVTEAACKTIVKQRLCCSGMRWTRFSVDDVLLSRGLIYSDGRWGQFWNKLDQYGI